LRDPVHDEAHLLEPGAAVMELPVQMRDEDGERTEGALHADEEQRPTLPRLVPRELEDTHLLDRMAAEQRVAEEEPVRVVARLPIGDLVAETLRDFRGLARARREYWSLPIGN